MTAAYLPVFLILQSNFSTKATLGTEVSGRCGQVAGERWPFVEV